MNDLLVDNGEYQEILIDFDQDGFVESWSKNNEWSISFDVYKTDFNKISYDMIENEISIIHKGQYFVVKSCEPKSDGLTIYKQINATHIHFDVQFHHNHNNLSKTAKINELVSFALDGNELGYTYEIIGDFDSRGVAVENFGAGADALQMLQQICQKFNTVLMANNKHFIIIKEDSWGTVTQKEFRYLYNIAGVSCSIDSTELRTKIKVSGKRKDDSEGGGYFFQPFYVTTKNKMLIKRFGDSREQDPISDERFTNKDEMEVYAFEQLHDYYNISLTLENSGSEPVEAGEQWMFIHEPLGIHEDVKIVGYRKYHFSKGKSDEVILSNEKKDIINIYNQIMISTRKADQIATNPKTFVLDNIPQFISTTISQTIPRMKNDMKDVVETAKADKEALEERINTTKEELEGTIANLEIEWDGDFEATKNELSQEIKQSVANSLVAANTYTDGIKASVDADLTVIENKQGQMATDLTSTANKAQDALNKADANIIALTTLNQELTVVRQKAVEAYDLAQLTDGKLIIVNQTVDNVKGQLDTTITKVDGTEQRVTNLQLSYDGLSNTVSTVEANLEDLTIGSRNMLTDTENEWVTTSLTSGGYYRIYKNTLNSLFASVENEYVTFSFEAKVDIAGNFRFYGQNGNPMYPVQFVYFQGTLAWKRFSVTVKVTKHPTWTGESKLEFWGMDNNRKVYIRKFKMNRGKTAFDWSPAPEELIVMTEFSNLTQKVDLIQTTVGNKADQTQVNQLADQWQQTTTLANGHTGQIANLGSQIDLRVETDKIITGINISGEDSTVKIVGRRLLFDGEVTMTDAYINKLYVDSLFVSKFSAQSLTVVNANIATIRAGVLVADSVTSLALKVDTATINKIMANSLLVNALYADTAFLTSLNTQTLSSITANITSIRSQLLVSNVIEADMLKASQALFDKVFADSAYFEQIASNEAFFNKLQVRKFVGAEIEGGVFTNPFVIGVGSEQRKGYLRIADGELNMYTMMKGYPEVIPELATILQLSGSQLLLRNNDTAGISYNVIHSASESVYFRDNQVTEINNSGIKISEYSLERTITFEDIAKYPWQQLSFIAGSGMTGAIFLVRKNYSVSIYFINVNWKGTSGVGTLFATLPVWARPLASTRRAIRSTDNGATNFATFAIDASTGNMRLDSTMSMGSNYTDVMTYTI